MVRVVHHPGDSDNVEEAWASGDENRQIYLEHLPLGLWLQMDGCAGAPFCDLLQSVAPELNPADAQSLVFLEPATTRQPFKWREYPVPESGGLH